MHQRQAIRDAVVALLIGKTAAGSRVTATQTEPWKKGALPTIGVYTPDETVRDDSKDRGPRELERDLDLKIICWAAHSEAFPAVNALDDLAQQVEAAMDLDPYLGGAAGLDGAVLSATETAIEDDERRADPLIGVIRLTYSVPYVTSQAAATNPDYLRTGVTTQIEGAGADNVVSDLVNQQP